MMNVKQNNFTGSAIYVMILASGVCIVFFLYLPFILCECKRCYSFQKYHVNRQVLIKTAERKQRQLFYPNRLHEKMY